MLKNYELLYIVHPDLEGTTEKVTEKVAGFVAKIEGKITNQEDWGKRKLAYPISHNDSGVYVLIEFAAESEKLHELERNLRLSEELMRFLVVALPEVKAKAPRPVKEPKKAEEPIEVAESETKSEKVEPVKKPVKAEPKETVKAVPKAKKPEKSSQEKEAEEKDRLKKLDEKLEEILGEDQKE